MLHQHRIATLVRIEDADAQDALDADQHERDRQHRRAQHVDQAGGVHRPDEQRQAEPGHARRTHLVDRHQEIQPGEDRAESGDEDADHDERDVRVRKLAAVWRVKRPTRVDAAEQQGGECERAADQQQIPAGQIDLWKRQIASADHHRYEKITQRGGDRGDEEEEHHHHAVDGEQLVVGFAFHHRAGIVQQVDAHERRGRTADHEEEQRDQNHVQDTDALVIGGQQPGAHLPTGVEIRLGDVVTRLRRRRGIWDRCCSHDKSSYVFV